MRNLTSYVFLLVMLISGSAISEAAEKGFSKEPQPLQKNRSHKFECGTYKGIEKDILNRHLQTQTLMRVSLPTSQTRDIGNIALLEDDGFIISNQSDGLYIDDYAVANAFYASHPDSFDFITMFRNFDASMFGFAYHFQAKNEVEGIGVPYFDNTVWLGSQGRLQGFTNQNDINYQVDDPHFHMYRIHSIMSGMLHETMHQWAAFLNNDNQIVNSSHWYSFCDTKSNYGDSTTSAMEGYMWNDLGGGNYQGYAFGDGLSPLDLYVMGLYDSSQVSPIWYLQNPTVTSPTDIFVPPYYALPVDLRATGTPQLLSIQDIVQANGLRSPDTSFSQKTFNMAFILVVKNGEVPKGEELARIDSIRKAFENYFYVSTGGLATMNTSLFGSNNLEIVTGEMRGAAIGFDYDEPVYAVGGTEPYTWSLQGTLPPGLTFNTSTGTISGTPAALGNYNISVAVQDAGIQTDSVNLILSVSDTGQSKIVINELELWRRYNVGAGVELYNKGNKAVNLTDWVLEMNGVDGRIIYAIPAVVLPPKSFLVILESSGINTSSRLFIGQDIDWAYNEGGFCALKDNLGNGVDFVRFGSSTEPPPAGTFWSGTNPIVIGEFHNLVRDSLSTDLDKSTDFVECNGNLGRKNLCASSSCVAKSGDVTGEGGISPADLVALINHLFKQKPAPVPLCRGDVTANGMISPGDLVYLINFLFRQGPAPLNSDVCCL